jgi:glycosylphosphatidylinositol transamidase (GPIT) subunit GPI8
MKHLILQRDAQVFNDESHRLNVYGTNVEVDYRGYEVTVENFIRVLTGELHSTQSLRYCELCSVCSLCCYKL